MKSVNVLQKTVYQVNVANKLGLFVDQLEIKGIRYKNVIYKGGLQDILHDFKRKEVDLLI
jgi:hypothetical protein